MPGVFESMQQYQANDINYKIKKESLAEQQAEFPYQLEKEKASARMTQAEAESIEVKTAQQKKLASLAAQSSSPQGLQAVGMADRLEGLSEQSMNAGMVDEASKLAIQAATLRQKASAQESSQTNQQLKQLEMEKVKAETAKASIASFHQRLSAVNSQPAFEKLVAQTEQEAGQSLPELHQPFSQALKDSLLTKALSQKDKIELGMRQQEVGIKEQELGLRAKHEGSYEAHAAFRDRLASAEQRVREARETRLAKVSGNKVKPMASPTKLETDQATGLVSEEMSARGSPIDKKEAARAGYAIASQAKVLMKENAALDADTAMRQALSTFQKEGDFQQHEQAAKGILGMFGKKEQAVHFSPNGNTPSSAGPVPTDKSKLVKGKYYSNGKSVGKWNGTSFVASTPVSGKATPDDEEEGDE